MGILWPSVASGGGPPDFRAATEGNARQMMSNSSLGNTRLRNTRQGLGLLSQRAFADAVTGAGRRIGLRLSVAERTVRRWESGSPPWPSPHTRPR